MLGEDLIIIGNVVGGHKISDIGVTVPYRQAVRLSSRQVDKSKDLVEALQQHKVYVNSKLYSSQPTPTPVTPEPARPQALFVPVPEKIVEKHNDSNLSEMLAKNNALLTQQVGLMSTLVSKMEQMKSQDSQESITKFMSNVLDQMRGMQGPNGASSSTASNAPQVATNMYIPSNIISSSGITESNIKVNTSTTDSAAVTDKLANLKKFKSKKK